MPEMGTKTKHVFVVGHNITPSEIQLPNCHKENILKSLTSAICVKEIEFGIKNLSTKKALDSDDSIDTFCHMFKEEIIPILNKVKK